MFKTRHLMISLLCASLGLAVVIGASCPPPATPFFLSITTNRLNVGTQVPDCVPGFVCISIVNTACADCEVALYTHDGFDPVQQYPSGQSTQCCPNPATAAGPCNCPRSGYQVGELQLTRPELFAAGATATPPNLRPIDGQNVRVLRPRESVLVQIQDGDVKSFGVSVGSRGSLLANPEIQDGPRYRCTLVPIPPVPGAVDLSRAIEDVPSGETFQFVVYDQSDCAAPGLARFATRVGVSASCPGGSR
jgi:hypothetical protein